MIGKRLKAVREQLGLSQVAISEKLGIAQAQYSTYERGDRKPSADILSKFVTIFNINVNYILTGEGSMFINSDLMTTVLRFKMPKHTALLIQPDDEENI